MPINSLLYLYSTWSKAIIPWAYPEKTSFVGKENNARMSGRAAGKKGRPNMRLSDLANETIAFNLQDLIGPKQQGQNKSEVTWPYETTTCAVKQAVESQGECLAPFVSQEISRSSLLDIQFPTKPPGRKACLCSSEQAAQSWSSPGEGKHYVFREP